MIECLFAPLLPFNAYYQIGDCRQEIPASFQETFPWGSPRSMDFLGGIGWWLPTEGRCYGVFWEETVGDFEENHLILRRLYLQSSILVVFDMLLMLYVFFFMFSIHMFIFDTYIYLSFFFVGRFTSKGLKRLCEILDLEKKGTRVSITLSKGKMSSVCDYLWSRSEQHQGCGMGRGCLLDLFLERGVCYAYRPWLIHLHNKYIVYKLTTICTANEFLVQVTHVKAEMAYASQLEVKLLISVISENLVQVYMIAQCLRREMVTRTMKLLEFPQDDVLVRVLDFLVSPVPSGKVPTTNSKHSMCGSNLLHVWICYSSHAFHSTEITTEEIKR